MSLRLTAPGNKRLAQSRALTLQHEMLAGALSESTKAWLGESVGRVLAAMRGDGEARGWSTWSEAVEAYLRASDLDKPSAPTKIRACRRFAEWAAAEKEPTTGDRSPSLARYLSGLVESGVVSSRTAAGTQQVYVKMMLNWMSVTAGVSARVDSATLRSAIPKPPPVKLTLPSHAEDLALLRAPLLRFARSVLVLVRGLACRPSEAMLLDWSTVSLAPGEETVTFRGTKDQKVTGAAGRTVPVLWTWVLDYLREIRGGARTGRVCLAQKGKPWRDQAHMTHAFGEAVREAGLGGAKIKPLQKLGIAQMIQAGFPAHVVAHWTGHTLSVQERYYMTDTAYLPANRDYEEYGSLTSYGVRVLAMHRGERG